jgi:hypothetical protein
VTRYYKVPNSVGAVSDRTPFASYDGDLMRACCAAVLTRADARQKKMVPSARSGRPRGCRGEFKESARGMKSGRLRIRNPSIRDGHHGTPLRLKHDAHIRDRGSPRRAKGDDHAHSGPRRLKNSARLRNLSRRPPHPSHLRGPVQRGVWRAFIMSGGRDLTAWRCIVGRIPGGNVRTTASRPATTLVRCKPTSGTRTSSTR